MPSPYCDDMVAPPPTPAGSAQGILKTLPFLKNSGFRTLYSVHSGLEDVGLDMQDLYVLESNMF